MQTEVQVFLNFAQAAHWRARGGRILRLKNDVGHRDQEEQEKGNISCFFCSLWLNKNHEVKDFVSADNRNLGGG